MGLTVAKLNILPAFGQKEYIIYILLSQRGPEYPGRHVQLGYPVDLLTAHDPLFRHGEDKLQMSAEKKTKLKSICEILRTLITRSVGKLKRIPIGHVKEKNSCMGLTIAKPYISHALGDKRSLIFFVLSQ